MWDAVGCVTICEPRIEMKAASGKGIRDVMWHPMMRLDYPQPVEIRASLFDIARLRLDSGQIS